jgi:ribosomal protein S18 acetylase RimI-like enzyme
MIRSLAGRYELDDDPARVDVGAVHDYLSNESYWAAGRSRETVERLVRDAARVVGLYYCGLGNRSDQGRWDRLDPLPPTVSGTVFRQVGFARAFSDGVALAYLADVYVLPEHRGLGLGVELVRELVERGPLAKVRWMLHTRDAHDLYRKLGFGPPTERVMERAPA